jgi:hypothetical protein
MAAVTNADYVALAEESSSADLIPRLTSLGASRDRAQRLSRFIRWRRKAKFVIRPAIVIVVMAALWIGWSFWLAVNGAMVQDLMFPSIAVIIAGGAIAITRAAQMTTGIDWEPMDAIPRALATTPRRVVVPEMPIASTIAASLLAMLIGIAGLAVPQIRDAQLLRRNGIEMKGKVVGRHIQRGRSKQYYVMYSYGSPEVHFQKRAKVSRAEYERMTEGSEVPVTFDPTHPLVSEPRSHTELRGQWQPLAPIVILLLVSILTRNARNQTEVLATRGVATLGRVTRFAGGSVRYEFTTSQGPVEGRMLFGKRKPARLPVEGETFVVFYDPDNPRRSMPLAGMQDVRFT